MPFFGAYPQTGSVFMEQFRRWLENTHWKKSHGKKSKRKSKKSKKVIFYSRAGGTSRRLIDPQQQEEILAMIRSKMLQYGRKEDDLVIYSGKDGDGNSLSIEDQFDFSARQIRRLVLMVLALRMLFGWIHVVMLV